MRYWNRFLRRHLFGTISVVVHAAAIALILSMYERAPSYTEVAVEFDRPALEEEPITQPSETDGQESPLAENVLASEAPVPESAEPVPPKTMEALLNRDFRSLRANFAMPASFVPTTTQSDHGFQPLEPEVHLTDGTINKLVDEGRNYADSGKKRKRRRGMGMGGGGVCR